MIVNLYEKTSSANNVKMIINEIHLNVKVTHDNPFRGFLNLPYPHLAIMMRMIKVPKIMKRGISLSKVNDEFNPSR